MPTSSNKVSLMPTHSSPASEDLMMIIDNPNTSPVNKKITLKTLFGNINSNTGITGSFTIAGNVAQSGNNYSVTYNTVTFNRLSVSNLTVASNGLIISTKHTPSNSTVSEAGSQGKFFFDDSYLYVKTANNNIKRVALSSF